MSFLGHSNPFDGSGIGAAVRTPVSFDFDHHKAEIERLEKLVESTSATMADRCGLAEKYVELAVAHQSEDELEEAIEAFEAGVELLSQLLESGDNEPAVRRSLGFALLQMGVVFNDSGEIDAAVEVYGEAIETLTPLAEAGDDDAKYDLAGLHLNLGVLYQELDQFDEAKTELAASFLAFRAIGKITDLSDTRYYMAKTTLAQAGLAKDMEEPLQTVVDLYNQAMQLFTELIDGGDDKYETDLASALLGKCLVQYDAGDCETVLDDLQRVIRIFEKQADGGNGEVGITLFEALTTYGIIQMELGKPEDGLVTFDKVLALCEETLQNNEWEEVPIHELVATVHQNRCEAFSKLQQYDKAIACINEAIRIRESLEEDMADFDDEEKALLAMGLAEDLCVRANVYKMMGNTERAKVDFQAAGKKIAPFADVLGDLYDEFLKQLQI